MDEYVRHALEHNAALRADFDEWRAAVHRIPQARKLPEPTFTYGLFLRHLETRVGPQRHRFSLQQSFPWPTKLTRAADAASHAARAAQQRLEARALATASRVVAAYWRLWLIEQERRVARDQLEVLRSLAAAAEARLEVGDGSLAELGQVHLSISRLSDALAGMDEQRQAGLAQLRATIGVPADTALPISAEAPPLGESVESIEQLRAALREHPLVQSLARQAESRREAARSAAAEGLPSFLVGVDYLETGAGGMPGVADDGKDPVMVKLGLSIPLWRAAYDGKEQEALAQSAAARARQAAALDEAEAELGKTLSRLRDTTRRVQLYRHTLMPQAETVYGSVLGSYQSGKATIAQVLLAQRDLLEIQLALYRAQAEHAVAWAQLERLAGRPVRSRGLS